jgi:hypothetical protein
MLCKRLAALRAFSGFGGLVSGKGSGGLVEYCIRIGRGDDAVWSFGTRDGHLQFTHGMVALDPPTQARREAHMNHGRWRGGGEGNHVHVTDQVAGDCPVFRQGLHSLLPLPIAPDDDALRLALPIAPEDALRLALPHSDGRGGGA